MKPENKAGSSNEAMALIGEVLKMARDEYGFSDDEQIKLWLVFLKAAAELSFQTERLMKERNVSRPEAIELAFKQKPVGLRDLIRLVSPIKYYKRHPSEKEEKILQAIAKIQ